jgi:hypothetical protein
VVVILLPAAMSMMNDHAGAIVPHESHDRQNAGSDA